MILKSAMGWGVGTNKVNSHQTANAFRGRRRGWPGTAPTSREKMSTRNIFCRALAPAIRRRCPRLGLSPHPGRQPPRRFEPNAFTGKVTHVKAGAKGTHFIDFCSEQAALPVLRSSLRADLKDVGDVRRLEGHVIEIRGPVKLYNGRAGNHPDRVSQLNRLAQPSSLPCPKKLRRGKNKPLQRRAECVPPRSPQK